MNTSLIDKMKIFDTHAHLGDDVVFSLSVDEHDLLDVYAKHNILGALIQPNIPRPYIEETRAIHNRIYKFLIDNPTYYAMISINPHFNYGEIEDEVQRCVSDLGFIAIKLHTLGYACSPDCKDGLHMFDMADEFNLPIMIHTGGGRFSYPSLLEKPIRMYKNLKIIIAHAGGLDGLDNAIDLALKYDNVYLEPSGIDMIGIKKLFATVGADKFMYSSDMPRSVAPQLQAFREACGDNVTQLEKVFYLTAKKVFDL